MFQFNFPIEEEEESSFPKDITDTLDENVKNIYKQMKVKLFSTNLEYLIENMPELIRRNLKDNYIVFGDFFYYSPKYLNYDFSTEIHKIEIQPENNPAIIVYKKEPLLFYVAKELILQMPQVILKSHTKISKNSISPTKIINPIFSLNLDPQPNRLIQLNLVSADKIELLEETKFYPKYTYSENNYRQI